MKKRTLLAFAGILLSVLKLSATDLCVEENGNFGCYSTITAAMSAATNGDRIIITPRAGNTAYVENLSITKTLQFLCAVDTQKYFIQGSVTVTPANGRVITFVGMKLLGNFTTTTNNTAGVRCTVSILSSEITGNVNFDYDYFNVNFSANILNGSVAIKYGKILGNLITCTDGYYVAGGYRAVYVGTDPAVTNDTIYVVGNRVNSTSTTLWVSGITMNTTNQYGYVANNFINLAGTYTSYGYGIFYNQYKSSAVSRNYVLNNTVTSIGSIYTAINFAGAPANAYTEVYNNLIIAAGGIGIYGATGTIGASYNYMNNPVTFSASFDNGTNNFSSNTTLDASGRPIPASDAINGASPDFSYYDLDLSVGDAGCFGGSFTLDNFFPINGSARVYMVYVPRRVNVSGTINIKADGVDR